MARMLVVDGDVANRELVRALLEREGHQVDVADEGHAALGLVARQGANLVVTELYMEGMEGLELLRAIRARWRTIAVVVMCDPHRTAAAPVLRMARAMGARGFLDKPVAERELLDVVREVVGPGRERSARFWSDVRLVTLLDHAGPVAVSGQPGEIRFELSRVPPARWVAALVASWDAPSAFRTGQRPGICRVEGRHVVLGDTTLEEVLEHHMASLTFSVHEANRIARGDDAPDVGVVGE